MTADLERALAAVRTVRANRAEQREVQRIGDHADAAYQAGVRMAKLDSIIAPAMQLAVQGSVLVVLLVGGVLVARGTATLGSLVAFLLYATYLVMPLSQLVEAAATIQRGLGALARVNAVFVLRQENDELALRGPLRTIAVHPDGPAPPVRALSPSSSLRVPGDRAEPRSGAERAALPNAAFSADDAFPYVAASANPYVAASAKADAACRGTRVQSGGGKPPAAIEFRDVWFAYAATPVLRGVSFQVPPRGQVALVGPSGAGKSTILELIERFYEPDDGLLLFAGRDVRSISRHRARTWVNLVEQNTPVLDGTLLDNIVYAAPDASEDDVTRVVAAAGLRGLADRLPYGLQTPVGDHGVMLSGGERQRVAIARALLPHPAVLLLDEPTSQLDAVNERALTRVMRRIATGRALLVIAHRISTVRAADHIIVLDQGRVLAQGSHEELMTTSAFYRGLASAVPARGEGPSDERRSADTLPSPPLPGPDGAGLLAADLETGPAGPHARERAASPGPHAATR
jgi:ATP-binding cassette subfamily B protein